MKTEKMLEATEEKRESSFLSRTLNKLAILLAVGLTVGGIAALSLLSNFVEGFTEVDQQENLEMNPTDPN